MSVKVTTLLHQLRPAQIAFSVRADRYLRKLAPRVQRKATENITTFALYMGKALTQLREREPVFEKAAPVLHAHQQGRCEGTKMERLPDVIPGHPRLVDSFGTALNACPGCSFKAYPKANDPTGLCDVHVCDDVSEVRAAQI